MADPSKDYEASMKNPDGTYKSTVIIDNKYFLPGKHYSTNPVSYPTFQHCVFALRLTNSVNNQLGYATYNQRQRLIYGFSTEIEFQFIFPYKYFCGTLKTKEIV